MCRFLIPILLDRKVFVSIETRRLIEQAFLGSVNQRREGIRQLTELIANKAAHKVAGRYLIKLR